MRRSIATNLPIEPDNKPKEPERDYGDYYDDMDEDCWQCGGSGFTSSCLSEYACVDPEYGCDQCTRKCDVCS